MSETRELVRVSDEAGVRAIVLDRAEKSNALMPTMLDAVARAISTAHSAGCVLLDGEGEVFSSGFDLELAQSPGVLARMLESLAGAVRAIRSAKVPVVVSAHGAAIAGASALVSACDVAIATREGRAGYPVLGLGVSPAISAPTLALATSLGVARAWMLSNRVVSMRDAMRVGLVHELVDGATACRSRARAVAAELAKKPAHALLETRTWMSRVEGRMHGAIEPLLRLSHEASASLAGGEEERSLMAKALARRRES